MENPLKVKSYAFALRVVKLYKYLTFETKEYVLSKQALRSGTSIGANITEGNRGQSKSDFVNKLSIALKEADETHTGLIFCVMVILLRLHRRNLCWPTASNYKKC